MSLLNLFTGNTPPVPTDPTQTTEEESSSFLNTLAGAMTDPAFRQNLNVVSEAMGGTSESYQSALDKYVTTLQNNAAAKAAEQRRLQEREQAIADRVSDREFQTQIARDKYIQDNYTPESYQAYLAADRNEALLVRKPISGAYATTTGDKYTGYIDPITNQPIEGTGRLTDPNIPDMKSGDWVYAKDGRLYNKRTGEFRGAPTELTFAEKEAIRQQAKLEEEQRKAKAEQDKKNAAAVQEARQELGSVNQTIAVVDNILERDLTDVTGPVEGRLPTFFEETKGTEQLFRSLNSNQFLANVSAMKGMGALSNAEGAKISAASSALFDEDGNLASGLSEEFVKTQLNDIRETLHKGKLRSEFIMQNGRIPTAEEELKMFPTEKGATPAPIGSVETYTSPSGISFTVEDGQ